MRLGLILLTLGFVLAEASPSDPIAPPLYFAAGVAHPATAKGSVWFVCDSPRGIYPQTPDCDVPWRDVTATDQP